MTPRRIALVVPGGVDRSGEERVIPVLLWLIEELAQRHEVHVVALHQYPEPCTYPLLGATVHNLGVPQTGGGLPGWGLASLVGAMQRLARETGPWDVLHGFWAGTTGWLAAVVGRTLRVPALVSLGGGEMVALPEIGYGAQRGWRSRWQVTQALRLTQRITVATEFMRGQVEARGFRAEVVPLGVAGRCFGTSTAPDGPPWRLLQVASLNPVKDQATLLRALRHIVAEEPRVHLDLVGEDTLNGAVQRQGDALGLAAHVTFHGLLPNAALRPFFEQSHLFVLTSRHEAGPVAVLEAAACGLPTVGTAVGQVADWAGEAALAVPVGDDGALAAAILALLRDPARRAALGRAAHAWARRHTAAHTAAHFEALYEEMLR